MFERFFKDAFGPDFNGAGMMQYGFQPSRIKEEAEVDVSKGREILVEKIDLGDSILVIMEGYSDIDELTVEVIEKTIAVDNGLEKEFVEIPVLVDIEKSGYSFRNGILEIRLQKIVDEITIAVKSAGILDVES
jgi:HSP20 family molecular chaperone IbpA